MSTLSLSGLIWATFKCDSIRDWGTRNPRFLDITLCNLRITFWDNDYGTGLRRLHRAIGEALDLPTSDEDDYEPEAEQPPMTASERAETRACEKLHRMREEGTA